MPSKHEYEQIMNSGSLTDQERRDIRLTDAGIAFEMMPESEFQARNLNPAQFRPRS